MNKIHVILFALCCFIYSLIITHNKIRYTNIQNQKLSKNSKAILKDFEKILECITKNPIKFIIPQSRRALANKFFLYHEGKKEQIKYTEDISITAIDGYKIKARKYYPENIDEKYVLLFVHGGGWIQGNLDTHDTLCRKIAKALECVIIAVDYRLAPEYQFPIPLNDVVDAYKWCAKKFSNKHIIISGDSAGGNLCAATCIKLHNDGFKKPFAQILFYAALTNDFESESFKIFKKISALSKLSTMYFFNQYIGNTPNAMSNPLIYPSIQDDITAFPKTILIVAECDVLLDGQLKFAKKLSSQGIDDELLGRKRPSF